MANTPISTDQRSEEIAKYAAALDAAYPPGPSGGSYGHPGTGPFVDFGQEYIAYMDKHPDANPELIYDEVVARLALLVSVPAGIGKAIAAGTAATAQTAGDTGSSVTSLYPAWLQGFLGGNGIIRVVEGTLGIVVIAVALDKIMGGNAGPATTIAKVFR
jgi:hypothetical protein